MIPPMTPPGAPPGTPPGTPPTTPALAGGGSSSSLIIAISFGICFGAVSWPASNWRGTTFTTFTGAAAGGGEAAEAAEAPQETGQLRLGQRIRVDQRNENRDTMTSAHLNEEGNEYRRALSVVFAAFDKCLFKHDQSPFPPRRAQQLPARTAVY